MSYILDALRKADAQRERDSSRGIHAHPAPLGVQASKEGRTPWLWGGMALVLALALAVAVAWYFAQDRMQGRTPERNSPPAMAAASPAPVVAAAPPQLPSPSTSPPPQQPQQSPMPANVIAPPPPAPIAPAPRPTPQPTPAREAPPAPASIVAGLPADAPRVTISGGVYSPSPVQRMLIVNGQVFNEGSEIAPGLVVEEIKSRTAVLKFRGGRYTVAY